MIFYHNDHDLGEVLQRSVQNRDQLTQMGNASYKRFLAEHTWIHRMREILQVVSLKN
jgi:hypothetical protein